MPQKIVVSLFDYTGIMVAPWAAAGFTCYCVDLRHPVGEHREGNIIRVGADVGEWLPPYGPVKIFFAFPPCTHVAASGARWFKDKGLGSLIEALHLFQAAVRLAEWTGAPYMIENPVSTVSTYCANLIIPSTLVSMAVTCVHLVMRIPRKHHFGPGTDS